MLDLDQRAAKEIMGWQPDFGDWITQTGNVVSIPGWSPTTRIAHAWMLVEKMKALGFTMALFMGPKGFAAGFDPEGFLNMDYGAETWHMDLADWYATAPLAITKAALTTVEPACG